MLHLQRALRRGRPVGVVLLDLDRLKAVNDSLGHAAGDQLLQVVAGRLADLPRPVVLAARLSGDEFVLVVHGDPGQTLAAAQAARQAIGGAPVPLGTHHRMQVTASAGTATAAPGLSHRQLLHHADLAMYQAKTTGDAVAAHTPDPAPGPVAPRPLRRSRDRRPPPDPTG
jgi:diguanylate cyclase (GGDEF)-like protein